MSMDSTHNMPGPPKDQKAAEEALTKLLREATAIASDRCTDMARSNTLRAAGPSVDAMLGPVADLKDDRFPGTPSPGRPADHRPGADGAGHCQSAGGRKGHPSQDFSPATKADRGAGAEAIAEATVASGAKDFRSEERRVGKEC